MEVLNFDKKAHEASELLKALSHEARLMILCLLADGEKKVQEMEGALEISQSSVSQHLTKLRLMGLVDFRKEGVASLYSIKDANVLKIVGVLKEIFCH